MNMRSHVEEYLTMRRSLGFKLDGDGRMLLNFADRLDRAGRRTITIADAVAWAVEPAHATAGHHHHRLGVVRAFARHLSAIDPECQIPAADLLPARAYRPTPYHYSAAEIAALVHAAGTIASPLLAATVAALISLIAASGLRLGEALALDRRDVDLREAALTVTGKNDLTRLIPLHPTTVTMLAHYAARRDRLCPSPVSPGYFLTRAGRRVQQRCIQETFVRLLIAAGVETPPGRRRPRIHDLRHTFAVNVLVGWYQSGVDVQAHLPVLSTFLGHSSPESTYWYLQATPQILAQAAKRLENPRRVDEDPGQDEVTAP